MIRVCGNEDIINYNEIYGSGTHGTVYGTYLNENIVAKIFNIRHCEEAKKGEVAIHEYVYYMFEKLKNKLDTHVAELLSIPNVYGFKYLPNSFDPQCCMYYMDKLQPINNNLIQLSFNYDRDYDEVLSSGRYVGIDTLSNLLSYDEVIDMIEAMGSMMALMHYGMDIDGYDVEFVLTNDHKIYVIDYDKVNFINYKYPYIIKRKLTENDYDTKEIKDDNSLARLLASSIHYYPHPDYIEYNIWKTNYLNVARVFNKGAMAEKVLYWFEKSF